MNIDLSDGVFTGVLTIVSSAISGLSAWFLSRRKSQAEVEAAELLNEANAIKIWQQMAVSFKQELGDLRIKFNGMQERMFELENENQSLRLELAELKAKSHV